MKWTAVCLVIVTLLSMAACGNTESRGAEKRPEQPVAIEPLTPQTAVTDRFLDSVLLESFISKHDIGEGRAEQLRSFYRSRNYQYAWFTGTGLAQQARAFWNLHDNYVNYSRDSSFFNKHLHRQMQSLMEEDDAPLPSADLVETELELTDHFFDYAQYAFEGKIDPDEIKWHIPRKKVNAVILLDSLVARNGQKLDDWEPLNASYKNLRRELLRLYSIQKRGGWPAVPLPKKAYKPGDSAQGIVALKQHLRLRGDYTSTDNSPFYSTELEASVKSIQRRLGLTADGVVGSQSLKALNLPVEARIEQMLVNLERMRWMPKESEGRRLVANIPEFRLHVYEGAKEAFQMNIVVGKAANKTVVFNDELKHIVFSPYWNIPRSIVRGEILPAMRRSGNYLSRNNMEQTGTSGGLPVIRQKPGPTNSLGRVKFLFPNHFNIYFHDTPAKSLFSETRRAFSHGCIRLAEPKKLATYLLGNRPEWTEERIDEAMQLNKEKWVNLEESVPVVISYFTAWVDGDGLLNFREDIYGHDKELADRLFEH